MIYIRFKANETKKEHPKVSLRCPKCKKTTTYSVTQYSKTVKITALELPLYSSRFLILKCHNCKHMVGLPFKEKVPSKKQLQSEIQKYLPVAARVLFIINFLLSPVPVLGTIANLVSWNALRHKRSKLILLPYLGILISIISPILLWNQLS